ncbi:elongin-A isoform X1 [Oryzias melastigma]|uniref:Elongin-A n=1 Tax=Oryzias melastigma TaxID=30732 RepID=A0A3B3CGN5_ORYME|nr:elongin-A isoform X1 [Oryzias melastigma]
MAEDLLETVERLQSRILDNPEPRKLLKALKRLGELPMTVHILVETGVGKTVNSFRKHQVAGELAKSLVAKWKKLVPQSADRPNSHAKEGPCSQAQGHRHQREPSPEEQSYMEEEEEEQGYYHGNYSPSPPHRNQYSPPQPNAYQSDEYESPEQEPEPSPPPPPPPPRKEVRHAKPSKDKNHHHSDRHKDRDEERRQRPAETSTDRGGGGDGKKRSGERERQSSPVEKVAKHSRKSTTHSSKREEKKKKGGDDGEGSGRPKASKDSPSRVEEEEEFEKHTMSFESFLTYDTPVKKKKKKQQLPSSSSHKQPSHSSSSRHSRTSPPPAPSSSGKESKANGAQGTKRPRSSSSSSAAGQTPEKRRRVVEALPTLPEIPLPAIQPNYRPLPSIETPLSPQRRKVPVCNDEEDAGFTGKRFNSKMVVYSGSKTAYLPKMMTLYEQCIRVLQNNIDSIAEVGGVPYEILEPVLERCTPEQLYRIELSNQCFTEESDDLWKRHCQRDFKRESPQEFESWREMYLRLHDEREERLRMLTQNITSAHANKPKGRQVKMAFVNSVAKPPRDVRRRQEKFGTTSGSSTASIAAASPIKIRPVVTDDSRESSSSSSSLLASPAPSSRLSAPSGGGSGGGGLGREKPAVKKIAPMMAKTIKAFKNRFSRR